MATTTTFTATDILTDVVHPADPSFATEFAHKVLGLQLSAEATVKVRDLLQRNNAGSLTPEERQSLDKYLMVGQFIDLMQAKARVSLHAQQPAAQ